MALIKTSVIDQITVTEFGTVLYREATRVLEDGVMISQSFHRSSLEPGQGLIGVPESVSAICRTAWTPAVVAAYCAKG